MNRSLAAGCIALMLPAWPSPAQTGAAAPSAPDQRTLDAALQLYSALLLQTAQARRSYPAAALEQKLSGNADIEISIGADGKLNQKRLVTSSNHRILDEHALQLLEQAVPLTQIPSALDGRAFSVLVSVNYVIPE